MVPAIIALAQAVLPWAGEKLFGESGEKIAETAVEVAKGVTGLEDPADMLTALKADPELMLKAQRIAMDQVIALERENTVRLTAINETMRAETASSDGYVRRARPTFIYVIALAFGIQIVGMTLIGGIAVVMQPEEAGKILKGLAEVVGATIALYGVALPVCGVYLSKRSQDKAVAAGHAPLPGILDRILPARSG